MTLQPADLDRLEQLAREADELRWAMTDWWYPPSALLDVDARLIATLSPAVVSELVAAARLGAAWNEAEAALPEGWRGPWLWPDPEEGPYVADAASGEIMPVGLREVGIRASGPTPAAALAALAEALRERP